MLGGYDDREAFEDDIYCEESSSEASIDSEVEFHLYSQVHYAQGSEDVNGEENEAFGSEERQSLVSKQDKKTNFIIISDSSPDIITLSDTPDEDSIYKSKLQKLTTPESPVPGRTYNLTEFISPKPARDSSQITLNSKRQTPEMSRVKKRTNEKLISFHRDVRMIHKILVIEDSSSDENVDVASIASESDNVESWMLLGGARDDKDDNILLNLEGCGTSAGEECCLVFIFLQIHSLTNDPSTVGFLSRQCDSSFNGSLVEANGEGGADWTISDKDLEAQVRNYVTVRCNNRYYMPDKNVTCRNCDKRGHLSKNCPTPKKLPPCCLCAQRGHLQNSCPARFCLNCCLPGHYSRECLERTYWKKRCNRCDMRGHYVDACPEMWRQYHLTTKPGPLKRARTSSEHSALIYCYNCAEKGHYGYECSERRMFGGTFPTSPFIYYYDNEYDIKRITQRAKKKVQELQEAGLMPEALKRPQVDDGQKVHDHKRKRKRLKDHGKRGENHHKKLKKKSQGDTLKRSKDEKVVQGNYTMEEDFPRGCHLNALKRSRKTSAHCSFSLPTNSATKQKRKKKQNYARGSSTTDESLFLIKQRKKKSKQKPSC
ncbi:LOW QUALITY PROTEIN: zinc finger CCHC domain-containing protein 7 [Rhineura floridana]|uniref:LOW QUALITY PROTEIN: zinc finger CCHC domain-containing protein 7 n=1 Tax=Rhineura floridana TaxID=261503 RepID=UPI002AC80E48|nr:LOW QUALITY PROTEIN: zinc finger CCHC domain-containing protein 7 [Rhineura floridana]